MDVYSYGNATPEVGVYMAENPLPERPPTFQRGRHSDSARTISYGLPDPVIGEDKNVPKRCTVALNQTNWRTSLPPIKEISD
jgi:hypothetical protein